MKVLCALALAAAMAAGWAQEFEGKPLVRVALSADSTEIAPGGEVLVGIEFQMEPGWHIYWENPGDAGLPTTIEWELPEGFSASPAEWPIPNRIIEPGDIQVLAFKDRAVAMAKIRAPASASGEARIKVRARWLVCKEICIPGAGEAVLVLPVGTASRPANVDLFAGWSKKMPAAAPIPYRIAWDGADKRVTLTAAGVPEGETADFFPLASGDTTPGHPAIARSGGDLQISFDGTLPIRGLFVLDGPGGREGWWVDSASANSAAPSPQAPSPQTGFSASPRNGPGFWKAILYGILGGLILNLMPCVLPVISLKLFGFIRQAGDEPRKIFLHGIAFSAGIFAWFFGLAAVIAGIRAGGGAATWAFQFQNPWFNLAISTIVFVFALNLFGVFEIVLPGKAAGAMDRAGGAEGYAGSFWHGVFATLLATPCTAPFLGTALGFAFAQPWPVIFAMFAAVAFGMALPYILLSANPGWMKILPRPGPWMERLKQFMGFPLLATLVWLLSILSAQKGAGGVIWASTFFVCLGFAAWLYGAFCGPLSKPATRIVALLLVLVSVAGGGAFFIGNLFANSQKADERKASAEGGIGWVPFSAAELDRLRAEGRGVFLDFTADWCITCKYNERTAIDRPAVREALEKREIVAMKADWTNANPEITKALAAFGRVGVPFYVFYPPGEGTEAVVLPEILTEQIVLDALAQTGTPAAPGAPR